MGDRSQVAIKQPTSNSPQGRVYLYSHWGGAEIYGDVQRALVRAPDRHEDPEYLTRVIFSEMGAAVVDSTTGYGIGLEKHDDIEHPLIVLDCEKKIVSFEQGGFSKRSLANPVSFADYMKLADVATYCEPAEEDEKTG